MRRAFLAVVFFAASVAAAFGGQPRQQWLLIGRINPSVGIYLDFSSIVAARAATYSPGGVYARVYIGSRRDGMDGMYSAFLGCDGYGALTPWLGGSASPDLRPIPFGSVLDLVQKNACPS